MKRNFNITMHVPLGCRHGTLCFTEEQSVIWGFLEVLGNRDSFTGTLTQTGHMEITGRMTSLLRSFSYIAKGTLRDTQLKLNVTGDRYSFRITGKEIIGQEVC